jgi:hypothetical protein
LNRRYGERKLSGHRREERQVTPSESVGKFADVAGIIGAVVCVIAGFYLLGSNTADANSYLQVIAHGIGIYFIGKGLYLIQAVVRRSASVWFLESIRDADLATSD